MAVAVGARIASAVALLYTMPPFAAVKLAPVPPFAKDKGRDGIWLVVAKVPDVGNVTPVIPVIVNVDANAPTVARLPPSVRVDAPLLMPVPP